MHSPRRVEVRLCGKLDVSIDGRPVDVRRTARQGRLALAYLALHRGEPVTREQLMERLWEDPDPERVRNTLTQTVSRLRGALGADVLERLPNGALRLQREVGVDVEDAEDALQAALDALDHGAWERACAEADWVLARLTGGVLPGDEAEWLEAIRDRAREMRVEALEVRAAAALHAGTPHEAEALAREAVETSPARESASTLLMHAQAARGNVTQASETFHRLRSLLLDRYGVLPGEHVIDLHDRLLAGTPATIPRRGAEELPAALRGPARARFVGRAVERRRLAEAWASARAGEANLALLAGEPGAGKTRLAAHLARELVHEGAQVLYGACDEGGGIPYQPWVAALRLYTKSAPAAVERHVRAHGAVLGRLGADVLPGERAAPLSTDPEADRYLLFADVAGLLEAAAAERPVLVVLDDMQWADTPTLRLLRHVVASGPVPGLLLLAAYRNTPAGAPLASALAGLAREPHGPRLALAGLELPDVVELIEGTGADRLMVWRHELAGELVGETGGNPFFVVQLLTHLVESGEVPHAAPNSDGATGLPETVREVIAQRVGSLGEPAAGVLQAAAVIGREFDLDVLAGALGRDEDEVLDALEAGAEGHLVEELERGRFAFGHALVARVLAAQLGPTRLARRHARIADALEAAAGTPRWSEIAHHRIASGAAATVAIDAPRRAAASALERLAPDEAARWLRTALSMPTDAELRCDLLIELGEALRQAGEPAYRATLLKAGALARERGDAARLVRAALANSRGFESASGNVDTERVDALQVALAVVAPDDRLARARLLAQLQLEQTFVAPVPERRRLSDEAVALAEAAGDPGTLAHVLWARHAVLWTPDRLSEHRANAARLAELARRLEDPVTTFWGACDGVLTSVWPADLAGIDAGLDTMQQIADRVGQPILRWVRLWYGSWRAYLAGDLSGAARLAAEAAEVGAASGQPDAEAFRAGQLMPVLWDQGALGGAIPLLEGAVAEHPGLRVFEAWLALAYCEVGRPQNAHALLERVAAGGFRDLPWDIVWLTTACLYAEVCVRLRAEQEARALRPLLEPYADCVAFNAASVLGSTARFVGGLCSVVGDAEAADAHFAHALDVHQRLRAPGLLARTQCEWAAALTARGAAADGLLAEAARSAEALGLVAVVRRAAALREAS